MQSKDAKGHGWSFAEKGGNHIEKREAGHFSNYILIIFVGNQTANRRVKVSANIVWKGILDQLTDLGGRVHMTG